MKLQVTKDLLRRDSQLGGRITRCYFSQCKCVISEKSYYAINMHAESSTPYLYSTEFTKSATVPLQYICKLFKTSSF